jgi:hypothetical protein
MRCLTQFLMLMGIIILNLQNPAYMQSICTGAGQEPVMAKFSGACKEWKDYIGDVPERVPLKRIRVSVHILCKGDTSMPGSELDRYGNFAPTQSNRDLIRRQFEYTSPPHTPLSQISGVGDVYANLSPPKLNHGSPYLRDSRIRYVVDSVYFWYLDSLYEGMRSPGDVWQFRASCWHHCVEQNPGNNPDNVQVYLGAFHNSPNYAIPAHTDLVVSSGFYFNQQNPGNLRHEIAHALGLIHTLYDLIGNCKPYQDDGCDDTPRPADLQQNPCCWNGPECSNNLVDNNVDCHALTACQIGMIHAGLMGDRPGHAHKALLQDHCKYNPQQSTIIPNGHQETWMGPRWLQGDLIVSSGAELTLRCTVSLPQFARIIVEPGATLILDGALLTNVCGDMWGGIEVRGISSLPAGSSAQGHLIMRNQAQIEHAFTAVKLYATIPISGAPNYQSTGGSIYADHAVFRNNHLAVDALPNPALAYPCTLMHCKFIWSGPLRSSISTPPDFIHLVGVQGVVMKHTVFDNLVPAYRDKSIGIRGTECSGVLEANQFMFLKTGMQILQINGARKLKILNNMFSDCIEGITLEGAQDAVLMQNQFYIPVLAQHPCEAFGAKPRCFGLYLKNSTAYCIQKNAFSALHPLPVMAQGFIPVAGCIIEDSGADANVISLNTFSELNYGIEIRGQNRDTKDITGYGKGLQILCNAFYRQIDYAIRIEDGSVAAFQGEWDPIRKEWKPAGNQFYHFSGNSQLPVWQHWYDVSPVLYPVQYTQAPGIEYLLPSGSYDPSRLQMGSTLCHPDAIICKANSYPIEETVKWQPVKDAILEALLKSELEQPPFAHTAWKSIADRSIQTLLANGSNETLQWLMDTYAHPDVWLQVWQRQVLMPEGKTLAQKTEISLREKFPEIAPVLDAYIACHAQFSGNSIGALPDYNVFPSQYEALGMRMHQVLSVYPGFSDPCIISGMSFRSTDSNAQANISHQQLEAFVYPNPSKQALFIGGLPDASLQKCRYQISDVYGRIIRASVFIHATNGIDISALADGVYWLRLQIPDGNAQVLRFIKHSQDENNAP